MILKYHWLFRLITGFLASLLIVYFAYFFSEPSIIFTALFFLFLGSVLTLREKNYVIFQISYFWLVIFCISQSFYFYNNNLEIFDKGGDDKYFFKDWILLGYDDIDAVLTEYNPYKTFILPSIYYLKFLKLLGLNSIFSFHINLLNVFVGSLIPVFVYKIGSFFLTNKNAQFATLFVICYPFLNYQSVKIMRDVEVYLLFTILVYIVSTDKKLIFKVIFISIIIFLMWNLRKEAIIYILLLIGSFSFIQTKSPFLRGILGLLVILAFSISYWFVSTYYGLDFSSIARFSQLYDELRQETSGDSSIATMLKNSGFLGKIVSVPYIWLSPLPPPFLFTQNLMNLFISFGCLIWYYLMPRGFIELFQSASKNVSIERRNLSLSILFTILIGSLFISYTSGDPRHTLVFFPVFSIFCFGYFENRKEKFELSLIYITIFIVIIAISLYIYLKFLR